MTELISRLREAHSVALSNPTHMDSTKIDLMALAEGGGPTLSKSLSDLRGKSINKDLLSKFQQPQDSYDSIPKPTSPKSPGKKWTPPPKPTNSTFSDTLSPKTVVSAPAEKLPPIAIVSSKHSKIEEESLSPKLGDNPFLQKDRRMSRGASQEENVVVPKRMSRGDSSGYMREDESPKTSTITSKEGHDVSAAPPVVPSPANSVADMRARAALRKSASDKEEAKPQAEEAKPAQAVAKAAAVPEDLAVPKVPVPTAQAKVEALEAAVVKQGDIALAIKDVDPAAVETEVAAATEAQGAEGKQPLEPASGQGEKKDAAPAPMPSTGSCCVIA